MWLSLSCLGIAASDFTYFISACPAIASGVAGALAARLDVQMTALGSSVASVLKRFGPARHPTTDPP